MAGNKRGRKVGAVSFCKVTLAELNRILKPTASVVVSLRYAEMVGLAGAKMSADTSAIKALADNVGADVSVDMFDEDPQEESSGLKPTILVERFDD